MRVFLLLVLFVCFWVVWMIQKTASVPEQRPSLRKILEKPLASTVRNFFVKLLSALPPSRSTDRFLLLQSVAQKPHSLFRSPKRLTTTAPIPQLTISWKGTVEGGAKLSQMWHFHWLKRKWSSSVPDYMKTRWCMECLEELRRGEHLGTFLNWISCLCLITLLPSPNRSSCYYAQTMGYDYFSL